MTLEQEIRKHLPRWLGVETEQVAGKTLISCRVFIGGSLPLEDFGSDADPAEIAEKLREFMEAHLGIGVLRELAEDLDELTQDHSPTEVRHFALPLKDTVQRALRDSALTREE